MNRDDRKHTRNTRADERERIEGVFHPRHASSTTQRNPGSLRPVPCAQGTGLTKTKCEKLPAGEQHSGLPSSGRKIMWFATAVPLGALLLAAVPLLTAFEAHVVNVTAQIERRPASCEARGLGYWANHDGCSRGTGESIHAQKVREISQGLMGAFAHYTGEQICEALWMPNCGPNVGAGRLCRARAHTLADILNIATGNLDTAALIAAADNGTVAFDKLGLTPYSSVDEALTAIELVILDPGSSSIDLRHAAYVAERIYSFYEDENPFAPRCIYDPDEVPLCFERASDKQFKNQSTTTSETFELLDEEEVSMAAAALAADFGEDESDADGTDAGSGEEEGTDTRSERESRGHTGAGRHDSRAASASSEGGGRESSEDGESVSASEGGSEESETNVGSTSEATSTDESLATTTTSTDENAPENETPAACEICETAESTTTPAESAPSEETTGQAAEEAAAEPPARACDPCQSEETAGTPPADEQAALEDSPQPAESVESSGSTSGG